MNNLKWKIGEVEVSQIVELEDDDLFSSIIPDPKPEKILEIDWLFPHFAGEKGNLKALVQSFLIKSSGKNILVDTCNGNHKKRPSMPTWSELETDFLDKFSHLRITPEDIDYVACTHLHFDHVGWNTYLSGGKWTPTFPNARYLFSQKEYDYWIKKPGKEMIDDIYGIEDSVTPIVEAGQAEFVDDDYRLDENIYFIPTPGHTPHHVSIGIESQGKKAIISGDALHHPCQIAYQDWTTEVDTFPEQTVETRKKFLDDLKDSSTLLIGSHFTGPVAGKVVSDGEGLKFKV